MHAAAISPMDIRRKPDDCADVSALVTIGRDLTFVSSVQTIPSPAAPLSSRCRINGEFSPRFG